MKLTYYGGDGWGSCRKPISIKINYGEVCNNEKRFDDVTDAKVFYDSLTCEKAAWDMSGMELMEAHFMMDEDDGSDINDDLPFN